MIGMIWECVDGGPDQQVCEHVVSRLAPHIRISPSAMSGKPNLIARCGIAAKDLLEEGCERVIIVWDLASWKNPNRPICLGQDRDEIFRSVDEAGVSRDSVHLVCVIRELEAWLLSDGRALSEVLSRPTHTVRVPDVHDAWLEKNPKRRLSKLFEKHTGHRYLDAYDAVKIIRAMPDFTRVERCGTFSRFVRAVG